MKSAGGLLTMRVVGDRLLLRLAAGFCYLFALTYVGYAAHGLARHHATRGEMYVGLFLACVGSVLFLMLGMLTQSYKVWSKKVPLRARIGEFASYAACMGVLVGGVLPLPYLNLSSVQVLHAVLATSALSVSILVLGILSSALQAVKEG